MATNVPIIKASTNEFIQFDSVEKEIMDTFKLLIGQLIARRDALLRELHDKKKNYIEKEKTRNAALEELTIQIGLLSFRVNENQDLQQQTTDLYKQKIKDLETPTELPQPFLSCPQLSLLQTQITEFAELNEWKLDYSLKERSVLAVGKRGKANEELFEAKSLALDEPNQLIYITDSSNCRIQVVSFAGKFLKRFGQEILKSPYGIAVTENNVFVTDIQLHSLLQFSKKDCKLVTRIIARGRGEGELNFPNGLCTDYNNDVYAAERDNNRVSVFSEDLTFLKHLGALQLKNPRDVNVIQSSVVVLDGNPTCIHFYSRNGDYLRSCVTQGWNGVVYDPLFFCLDTGGNILISDCQRHNIKILSPSGQLIHKLGKKGHERGELYCPFGICLSQTVSIFVISWNNTFCLQSF